MPTQQPDEFAAQARAITAIRSPRFAGTLVDYLQQCGSFDCAVILGYSQIRRPVYLYDNLQQQRELLFQRYLQGTYQHDPFYRSFMNGLQPGVYSLMEILVRSGLSRSYLPEEYLEQFYQGTGWQNELGIVIQLDDMRWVVIFLGFLHRDHERFRQMQAVAEERFAVIAALCQQHWQQDPVLQSLPLPSEHPVQANIRHHLDSFAHAVLTPRERQVAQFILQGLGSADIALRMGIGVGTVKNHRKHLYAKLHVNSEAALFGLFLDGLMVSSP